MPKNRPFALSIAGLDPTAGAGILADIKTFEQHRVNGFAISTANSIQTENAFFEIQWTPLDFVLKSMEKVFQNYPIHAVKIGIIPSLDYLNQIVKTLKKLSPTTKIVWDTVLKSSTEFDFLPLSNPEILTEILKQLDLITPNYPEMQQLFPDFNSNTSRFPSGLGGILLKGGHHPTKMGVDHLYMPNNSCQFLAKTSDCFPKHGSGCVLSSAITARLALGENLQTACEKAKTYTENFLSSNPTKLGFHYV